jgi:hypothetical protein
MLFWRTTESIVAPATVSSSAHSNSARRRPKKPRPPAAKVFASKLIPDNGTPERTPKKPTLWTTAAARATRRIREF